MALSGGFLSVGCNSAQYSCNRSFNRSTKNSICMSHSTNATSARCVFVPPKQELDWKLLLSVCPLSQSFAAEAGQGRAVLHKLTLQALTNKFLPPLFVEIISHLGDGSGFFWKVASSVSRKLFRFATLCARCRENFPPAAVDKLKQIWADKSHPEWSNLVRSYNSVQYGPFRDRMRR